MPRLSKVPCLACPRYRPCTPLLTSQRTGWTRRMVVALQTGCSPARHPHAWEELAGQQWQQTAVPELRTSTRGTHAPYDGHPIDICSQPWAPPSPHTDTHAHLLGIAHRAHELLHRHAFLVGVQVALRGQAADVEQDVGISCRAGAGARRSTARGIGHVCAGRRSSRRQCRSWPRRASMLERAPRTSDARHSASYVVVNPVHLLSPHANCLRI